MNHVMLQGLMEGEKFCVASMEMPAAVTLWRLVRQISGEEKPSEAKVKDIMRWLDTRLWIFDLVGSAKSPRLFEVFRYAKCRYDIRNFVIDSFTKIDLREDDYSGQKQFAVDCVDFNHKHESTIHLICHTRKTENEEAPPAKFDIRGASGLSNVASTEISVWRYKKPTARNGKRELAEDPNHADTFLNVEKQRETGWLGRHALYFEPTSLQFHEQPMEQGINYYAQVQTSHDDGTF
jgi:twinkle protein